MKALNHSSDIKQLAVKEGIVNAQEEFTKAASAICQIRN
jgi:hypothetical protein